MSIAIKETDLFRDRQPAGIGGYLVTFLVFHKGKMLTQSRFIRKDKKDSVLAFLNSRKKTRQALPILELGEWEEYYIKELEKPKRRIFTIIKDILGEITNGRITVRGGKNAQG